ncbi:MAG: alpha/beta hydrolase [Microbacteriaceae bacterium]
MTDPRFPIPIDPEIVGSLEAMSGMGPRVMTEDAVRASRTPGTGFPTPTTAELIGDRGVEFEDRTIPGPDGAPELAITILRPQGLAGGVPVLYNIHGGGMIVGTKEMDTGRLVELVEALGVVAVNVEYRLAPEHPYPAGAEDVYAGFLWVAANAASLGGDPDRIVVMGGSAGGGFSAIVALLQRDRRGPALAGQLLLCPMIDNTSSTVSARQYADPALAAWPLENNQLAWRMVLGDQLAHSPDAPAHGAPSRAADLSGLAPAFIEVGSAEMFRDEDVEYASRIWAAGGDCELHVWAGGFHGFDMVAGDAEITRAAKAARTSWLKRKLGL